MLFLFFQKKLYKATDQLCLDPKRLRCNEMKNTLVIRPNLFPFAAGPHQQLALCFAISQAPVSLFNKHIVIINLVELLLL